MIHNLRGKILKENGSNEEKRKERTHGDRCGRVRDLTLVRGLEREVRNYKRENGFHLDDRHRAPDAVVRAVDKRLERVRARRGVCPPFRAEGLSVGSPETSVGVDDANGDVEERTLRDEDTFDVIALPRFANCHRHGRVHAQALHSVYGDFVWWGRWMGVLEK